VICRPKFSMWLFLYCWFYVRTIHADRDAWLWKLVVLLHNVDHSFKAGLLKLFCSAAPFWQQFFYATLFMHDLDVMCPITNLKRRFCLWRNEMHTIHESNYRVIKQLAKGNEKAKILVLTEREWNLAVKINGHRDPQQEISVSTNVSKEISPYQQEFPI